MDAGAAAAALKGDGEVQGEELPPWLLSAADTWRRSRPDNAAALLPPSEAAKGSLGVGGATWRVRGQMLDNNSTKGNDLCHADEFVLRE